MKSLKILYSFPLRMGISGVGITSYNIVKELIKLGHSVYLSVASLEKSFINLNSLYETFKIANIKLPLRIFGRNKTTSIHDKKTARWLRSRKPELDIVHCWPLCAYHTVNEAKEQQVKTVLERPNCHTGFAYEVVKNEYEKLGLDQAKDNPHTFDAHHLAREQKEYDLIDTICCPSEFVAKTFIDKGIPKDKIGLYHYGFDPHSFHIDEKSSNKELKIIFAGRLEPRKGLHYALEAWLGSRAKDNGKFYILGKFVPGYREILQDKLNHKSIVEIGFSNKIADFFKDCDALILPSIEEGSALVTYEASACGCLLLVSDSTGAQVIHEKNGLVHKSGDISALTEQLNRLSSDSGFKESLKQKSLKMSGQFTWAKAAQKLTQVYLKALGI